MGEIRFTSHPGALNSVLTSASRKIVTKRAQEVLVVAKTGEGAAKDTLRYAVQGSGYKDISATVGSNDPAVVFEEEGTKPHIIRARNGKVLKFPGTNGSSGRTIHVALVHHPGTRGKHILRRALRSVIGH